MINITNYKIKHQTIGISDIGPWNLVYTTFCGDEAYDVFYHNKHITHYLKIDREDDLKMFKEVVQIRLGWSKEPLKDAHIEMVLEHLRSYYGKKIWINE